MAPRESQGRKRLCLKWKGPELPPAHQTRLLQASTSFLVHLCSCHLCSSCASEAFRRSDFYAEVQNRVFFFRFSFMQSTVGKKKYFFPFLLRKKGRRGKRSITSSFPALPLLARQNNASGWSKRSGGFLKEDKSQIFMSCFQFLEKLIGYWVR